MNLAGIAAIALEHEIWLARTAKACEENAKDVKDTVGATTVNICAMFNAPLLKAAGVKYCQELAVLEDVDFCLQLVGKGLRLARFGNYGFKVPTSKTTLGAVLTYPSYQPHGVTMLPDVDPKVCSSLPGVSKIT